MDPKRILIMILFLAAAGFVFIYAGRLGGNLAAKAGV